MDEALYINEGCACAAVGPRECFLNSGGTGPITGGLPRSLLLTVSRYRYRHRLKRAWITSRFAVAGCGTGGLQGSTYVQLPGRHGWVCRYSVQETRPRWWISSPTPTYLN